MPADAAPAAGLRPTAGRGARIVFICIQGFLLLLIVRWCARTYPGLYFPESAFRNELLNGVGLFTLYGYDAVLLFAASRIARLFIAGAGRRRLEVTLTLVQWTSLAVAALLICYGIYWAEAMQRLPWQEDGWEPFLGTLGIH